jgi:iron complex transport system substrate-binding protein
MLALAAIAVACADDPGAVEDTGPPTAEVATSASSPEAILAADDPGVAAAFPVTIEHAFGETVIEAAPERVVAWGWGSADAAIALGVTPVAIPFQSYGGDEHGVLPWIRAALGERGAEVPNVLPDAQEPPFEAIAKERPDLILAVYSGITDSDYELLSAIAPTVAYPDQPWATPWQETIRMVGSALGLGAAADDLLADIDEQVATAGAAHDELAGKTVAMVWDTGDTFYVYEPADARVAFTLDLGLESASSVNALSTGESTFYFTLSKERLGELTSDILVSYADTPEASAAFLDSAPAQLMEQVRRGAVAEVVGAELIAAVSPPTALSLMWGLDEYVDVLAAAARAG